MKKGKVSFGSMATYSVGILKGEEATKGVPVIGVSAKAMPNDIEKGMELGFSDYITEPFKLKRFLGVVDEILRKC